MRQKLISILITNYNKGNYLKKTIFSCKNQSYLKKEIIIFDDYATDKSINILNRINNKNVFIFFNKKKKYKSSPLNQLYGIKKIFNLSRGEIIFLLDGDDFFLKDKLKLIVKKFEQHKEIEFIQDTPYFGKQKKKIKLKKKDHSVSIWPSFYPTSCIAIKRKFFKNFLKNAEFEKFPNLEIDARLSIFAFLKKKFFVYNKNLTIYNYDNFGISSNYKKFSINWWRKRNEAYEYMKILMKKMKLNFIPSFDFCVTKLIYFLLNKIN